MLGFGAQNRLEVEREREREREGERTVRKVGGLNRGRRAVRKSGELNRGKRSDNMWVLPHILSSFPRLTTKFQDHKIKIKYSLNLL